VKLGSKPNDVHRLRAIHEGSPSEMILSVIKMPLNVAYLGQFTRRSLELRMPDAVPAIHDETRGL
jgi:hypothetical protein